jgi:hypothetical protein
VAGIAVLVAAGAVAACGGGSPSTAYCDTVAVAQATADPLADPAVRDDTARLSEAFQQLVATYGRLAQQAPADVRGAASAARDGVVRVSNALAAVSWDAALANQSGDLSAALDDPAYAEALAELRRFNLRECGIG